MNQSGVNYMQLAKSAEKHAQVSHSYDEVYL